MGKNKKQRLRTVYQRHIDFWKFTGIILLLFTLTSVTTVAFLLETQAATQAMYYLLVCGVISFFIGIIFCMIGVKKQTVGDQINEKLYAIWKYKPQTIYRFYQKQVRYKKKTKFFEVLVVSVGLLVASLFMLKNEVSHYLGIIFLVASALVFVVSLFCLPYSQYLLLKIRTAILGDAKEIIFSRAGIWYCGKVYFFGSNGITYHRVERKELHGQDAIVFYYTRSRGLQQLPMELEIPIAPKMAYAADELVEMFNRSDLIEDINIKK